MGPPIDRRTAIQLGIAAVTSTPTQGFGRSTSGVLAFRLVETAGLRRVAEPVSTVVRGAAPGDHLRLMRDGRTVPAQFQRIVTDGHELAHALDFAADLGPAESARYEVHHGLTIDRGPAPRDSLTLNRAGGSFRIDRNHVEAFEVAPRLDGFLRSVGTSRMPFVSAPSPGLAMTLRGGKSRTPGQGGSAVAAAMGREGPFAIGLQFAWGDAPGVTSRMELTFPLTRHRVEARWTVHDPDDRVGALELDLDLRLDAPRTRFEVAPAATPGWSRAVEDRRQVLAVVADFDGRPGRDRVGISNEGRVSLSRHFSEPAISKTLAFWLDFAATGTGVPHPSSPRSLLEPIRVEWDQPAPSRG